MRFILRMLGELLDVLAGPCTTKAFVGQVGHATEMIDTLWRGQFPVEIVSRQFVYRTEYERWFIPDRQRAVYEVSCIVPDDIRDSVDPRLLETVTYPSLSIRLLRWTKYPHIYAIIAFLDRVHPGRVRTRVKLSL